MIELGGGPASDTELHSKELAQTHMAAGLKYPLAAGAVKTLGVLPSSPAACASSNQIVVASSPKEHHNAQFVHIGWRHGSDVARAIDNQEVAIGYCVRSSSFWITSIAKFLICEFVAPFEEACLRKRPRNSTLPSVPLIGDSMCPMHSNPYAFTPAIILDKTS